MLGSKLQNESVRSIGLDNIIIPPLFSFRCIGQEDEDLEGLTESIRKHGVLQPVLLRHFHSIDIGVDSISGEKFELVSGQRRYTACRNLGFSSIPSIIMELDDKEAFEVAIVENVQRRSLNPIEEAEAFKSYVMNFGRGSVTRLARRIGKSEEYVSHRLLLLGLPKTLTDRISRRLLNPSVATELIWIKNKQRQLELAESAEKYGLTLRQVRNAANIIKISDVSVPEAIDAVLNSRVPSSAINRPDIIRRSRQLVDPWLLEETRETLGGSGELATLSHAEILLRSTLAGLNQLVQKSSPSSRTRTLLLNQWHFVHEMLDEVIRNEICLKKMPA